ncbi:hypothetical protein [Kitasatospora griseola]|uniref:hypothetical protein n=1 Tax=Kitasatospora griseola TaxID=2064 RepID=UPI0038047F8D
MHQVHAAHRHSVGDLTAERRDRKHEAAIAARLAGLPGGGCDGKGGRGRVGAAAGAGEGELSGRPAAQLGGEAVQFESALEAAAGRVRHTTGVLWAAGDPEVVLPNASAHLEAVGHAVPAWIRLEQYLALGGADAAFQHGRAAGRPLVLPGRTPPHRPAVRPPRRAGPDGRRHPAGVVLSRRPAVPHGISVLDKPAAPRSAGISRAFP